MRRAKTILGGATLLLFLVAANVLIWERTLVWLYVTLGLALILAVGWLAAAFIGAGGRAALEGRAVGAVNAVVASAIFLGVCVMAYVFARYPDAAWDLTEEGRRELAEQTVQVLENMTREVEAICFFPDIDDKLAQISKKKTLRFLDTCRKYTDLLTVKMLDPHIDQASLTEMGITHLSPQGTVVVKSGARQKVIWFTGGSPRLEERDFTNALINVLRDAEPKVCFLTGHGERGINDEDPVHGASLLHQFLKSESYRPEAVAIKMSDPEVPEDCDLLVINGLAAELYPEELGAIDAYLDHGGRLLLLVEPWALARLPSGGERLRTWLADRYGVALGADLILAVPEDRQVTQEPQNRVRVQLTADQGPFQGLEEETPGVYHGCYNAQHALTRSFDQLMLLHAAGTAGKAKSAPRGVAVTDMLRTTPNYWAEEDIAGFTKTGEAKRDKGERAGPLPVAVAVSKTTETPLGDTQRMREARLVVVANEGFASNAQIAVAGGNLNFLLNAVAWLTQSEDLIAIRPSGKTAVALVLTPTQERAVTWIAILLALQLLLLPGGIIYLVRGRNR
ncbi:MAG TPA: GldG family protein [Candidatus Hydrogenedentes bacterium]|nr:GldG family protein [Candidatus Hydrogenedentota bacterium]HNT87864.1 GldG family protein [Candidatus Hydrogenedentota bacterium]